MLSAVALGGPLAGSISVTTVPPPWLKGPLGWEVFRFGFPLALGMALQWLRAGRCDVVLCGGTDAISEFVLSGFHSLRAQSKGPCQPFDRARSGLNLGEGAAFLVLESEEHASRRGQRIRAYLSGYGLSCDANHMTGPDRQGRGAARAMSAALADAGLGAEAVDFVSAHGGAIPAQAMSSAGQFTHPLVVRAKLEIAAACHAHGKVPSHCVVTELTDSEALRAAATRAAQELGYTRMWSIHPGQIRPILDAFAPQEREIERASAIIETAALADWAPIRHDNQLHDRASYRYYWQVIERAHQTGRPLPDTIQSYFLH